MGVEVVNANLDIPETKSDKIMSAENDTVDIKFGSHGVDEAVKKEVSESNLPKDVVDEWPEPMKTHSFYIVKFRSFEDPSLKAKLDLADKELQKKNQLRLQIVEKLRAKRADRSELIGQIRALSAENKQFRNIMDEKRKEMEPLQQALGKLRGPAGRGDKGAFICSSEEELNEIIKSLQYRIQHESIPLTEEKQILREIKQLEGTRDKVIAHAAERAQIQDSMGEKDAIQDQVKLIGVGLDGVRKEKQAVNAKLKQLDDAKLAIEKDIGALETELTAVTQKRDATFENIKELRKQREEGNTPFYQNRVILAKARSIAANKDVEALQEFAYSEVDKFLSLWNSNKAFRNDYNRRILSSLDSRQFSKDGRMRNPDEKSLVVETEVVKVSVKQPPQEDLVSPAQGNASSEQKVPKTKGAGSQKSGNKKKEITVEESDPAEQEEYFSSHKLQKDKEDVVDEKKLKELKKQEEMTKRKQAEERKKKLAEKAASKAAIKAEKEAEKKLKEREKRARKKSGAVATDVDPEEPTEDTEEVAEPEKTEEKVETTTVPQKSRDIKDNTFRARGRPRGQNSLPKAILKRKKATNYWLWAGGGAAAALVALILAIVGFKYLN